MPSVETAENSEVLSDSVVRDDLLECASGPSWACVDGRPQTEGVTLLTRGTAPIAMTAGGSRGQATSWASSVVSRACAPCSLRTEA